MERAGRPDDGVTEIAIEAHRLLGASAVVSMGIATLSRLWDHLPREERDWLLHRMSHQAARVDDGLKDIARGIDPGDGDGASAGTRAPSQLRRAEHLVTGDLVHFAVELGLDGADANEAAVELVALSGRNRKCLEMAITRCSYLPPGEDVERAVAFLSDALRLGDRHGRWLADVPSPYLSAADSVRRPRGHS